VSRVKFKCQWPSSRSQIGVTIQTKIWKCEFGPFSHHLLNDWNTNGHNHDYHCEAKYCTHNRGPCYQNQGHIERSKLVYRDHLVIIYWWIVTQMTTFMTTSVTHVSDINICKVKVTTDGKISRCCPDIAQSTSPLCISIMLTSFTKTFVMGVFCDNVALVCQKLSISLCLNILKNN
jgi:hypothetical protein